MNRLTAEEERRFLDRAVELGHRGWGRVHPNPMVGCVIVRDGQVVGEGWHREFGGPHAEVEALEAAGNAARDGTAYVSLEPCRHEGKTPPCTRALLEAGVRRVVFGSADPGEHSGGGGRELSAAGVEVEGPVFSPREARRMDPVFFHRNPERPWLTLKLAISLDGGIARRPGESTRLSGEAATSEVHRLRAGFDAIMVGARTARTDDPRLTVRGSVQPRVPPARIVLDGRGTVGMGARLHREGEGRVHLFTTLGADSEWVAGHRSRGARVHVLPGREGRVDLRAASRRLRELDFRAVLCEGGGVLGSALLGEDLVDRLVLIVAPCFLGPRRVPAFPDASPPGGGTWTPAGEPRRTGDDVWITLDREE